MPRKYIENSERPPAEGTHVVGSYSTQELTQVTIQLPRRSGVEKLPSAESASTSPIRKRSYLSREEFVERFGADPADATKLANFAASYGIDVEGVNLGSRLVTLSGGLADFSRAFDLEFELHLQPHGVHRSFQGQASVPENIAPLVQHVVGLDNRQVGRPQLKRHIPLDQRIADRGLGYLASMYSNYGATLKLLEDEVLEDHRREPVAASGQRWRLLHQKNLRRTLHRLGLFTPPRVAELYRFPQYTGRGQTIAVLEFGGGFVPAYLDAYFRFLGISTPDISVHGIAGAANRPGEVALFDTEVYLDLEVAGSIAPDAKYLVYFAPYTERGFVEAFSTALFASPCTVISASFGLAEKLWMTNPFVMRLLDELFQAAAHLGVTICQASGDDGARGSFLGLPPPGEHWADFPASSPHVLGCGGTHMVSDGGRIQSETVWNELRYGLGASGGGVSAFFEPPEYQSTVDIPQSLNPAVTSGRGVPDVASLGDPRTGYFLYANGINFATAGTSSGAPLWAALIARLNEGLGNSVGFLNPLLYEGLGTSGAFRDITIGNNDGYSATPGWDATTGFGTPHGERLLEELRAV